MEKRHSRAEMGYFDATALLCNSIAILPPRFSELRRRHNNLLETDACGRLKRLDADMNASTQPKDQARVLAIEYQVATSQQYLPRSRHSGGHACHSSAALAEAQLAARADAEGLLPEARNGCLPAPP